MITCSVDQHLPQFLLITGMDEVKHTVARQIKLGRDDDTKGGTFYTFLV